MSADIGVGLHETSVVGNGADKIHNKHAKVLQHPHPTPLSSCSTLVSTQTTGEEDGGMEATAAEARNSLNWDREQVFLLFQRWSLSEEE